MRNIVLKIMYDGTEYSGWQTQPNALTIQEVIEKGAKIIVRHDIELNASGRTDAGVHAIGQVANFKTDSQLGLPRLQNAINSQIPKNIRIIDIAEVDEEFHSRFSAIGKTYIYRIENADVASPFEINRSNFVRRPLNFEKMQQESKKIIGTHDFTSFKSQGSNITDCIRRIDNLTLKKENNIITMEISGNGFLYNMVRIIAGTLIEIGLGRDFDFEKIIKAKDRQAAGPTAAAHGLFLKEVKYPIDIWSKDGYNI